MKADKNDMQSSGPGPRPIHDTPGTDVPPGPNPTPAPKPIPPAAQRALAEAEERRKKAQVKEMPPELGGRDGPEPVRYGDWEKKGIAIDF